MMQMSATSNLIFVPATRTIEIPVRSAARVINRQQGMALETLAHAIEYLEDELASPTEQYFAHRELLDGCEAIERLKALHRGLWYSLPVRTPLWRRIAQWYQGPAPVITLPSA